MNPTELEHVALSDDDEMLLLSGETSLQVWRADNGEPVISHMHTARVRYPRFSPKKNGPVLFTSEGATFLWFWSQKEKPRMIAKEAFRGYFTTTGSHVLILNSGKATLQDVGTGGQRTLPGSWGFKAAIAPDNRSIATWRDSERQLTIRDLSGERSPICLRHKERIRSAIFSPNGNYVLTNCTDGVFLWTRDGRIKTRLCEQAFPAVRVGFSPDGSRVLTDHGSETKQWLVRTDELLSLATSRLERIDRTLAAGEFEEYRALLDPDQPGTPAQKQ